MAKRKTEKSERGDAVRQGCEPWQNEPISNRLTAAYHIGRLLNQLNWYLQHVLMFGSKNGHGDAVRRVLACIKAATYAFVNTAPNQLAEAVEAVGRRWEDELGSEAVADALYEIAHSPDWRNESIETGLQRLVESWIPPLVSPVREGIWQELSNVERWAMELGTCLDEGVRRPDVILFFAEEPVFQVLPTDYMVDVVGDNASSLYCRPVQSSEIEPTTSWWRTLQELLKKVGLPPADDICDCASSGENNLRARLVALGRTVEAIDQRIREHLTAKDSPKSAGQSTIPPEDLSRPMSKQEAARFRRGEGHKNPSMYFKRLIEEGSITPPMGGGQSWQFNVQDFPESVRDEMRCPRRQVGKPKAIEGEPQSNDS
jgi:hypothetical protein